MKLSFGCKADKFMLKDTDCPMAGAGLDTQRSSTLSVASFREWGTKETFFDTQPWLDSDCDDDFFSVNGDLTPSRGSTPVHKSISMGNSQANKGLSEDRAPKLVPTPLSGKKKKLVELFRDSSRGYRDAADRIVSNDQIMGNGNKSSRATLEGTSSSRGEKRRDRVAKPSKDRSALSVQCCLPSLSSRCAYNGGKKNTAPSRSRRG